MTYLLAAVAGFVVAWLGTLAFAWLTRRDPDDEAQQRREAE